MSMGGEITIRLPSLLTVSAHIGADIEAFVVRSETVKREEQSGRVGKTAGWRLHAYRASLGGQCSGG